MPLQNTKRKLCKDEKERNLSACSVGVGDSEMFSKSPVNVSSYQRLKIQENMLFSSAKQALKSITGFTELDVELRDIKDKRKADLQTLKDTYLDIKNTINILRSNISTLEKIKKIDVARYRTSVVELEERIVAFKRFLREELELLQEDEQTLVFEVDNISKSISQHETVAAVKSFTCVIPSKVKTLRTKPSISPEVQAFQEFVDRAGGHNGGWGHQEHSLFVKFRQKLDNFNEISGDGEIQESHYAYLRKLTEILCARIPGLTDKDVAHHEAWYMTYQKLKLSQQSAIEKWRALKQLHKYQQEVDKAMNTDQGESDKNKCLDKDKSDVGLQTTVVMVNKKSCTSPDRDHQLTLEEIESRSEAKKWKLESKRLEQEIQELSLKEKRSAEANRKLRDYRARDQLIMQKKKNQSLATQIEPPPAAPKKTTTPKPRSLEYKVYRQCDSIIPKGIPSDGKLHRKLHSDTKFDPKSHSDTTVITKKQSDEKNKKERYIRDLEKTQSDTKIKNNIESDFTNLSNSRCYKKFMRNCNFEVFSGRLSNDTTKMNEHDKIEKKKSSSDTMLQCDIESGDFIRMVLHKSQSEYKSKSDTTLSNCYADAMLQYNAFDSKYSNKSEIALLNEIDSGRSRYDFKDLEYNDSNTKFMCEVGSVLSDNDKFEDNNKSADEFMNEIHFDTIESRKYETECEKKLYDTIRGQKNKNIDTFYDESCSDKTVIKNDGQCDANQSSDMSKCGFAAPTKEWSQRINKRRKTRNKNDWSRVMAMENIPKLGQPKWRRPLSANQGI